ncbi:MAG: extensin family protein [Myxococcota bacterium]
MRFALLTLALATLVHSDIASANNTGEPEVNYFSFFEGWPPRPGVLDETPRFLEDGQRMRCDPSGLVRYRGTHLRFAGSVRAHPSFVARLKRFEVLVNDFATRYYGRPPRRLIHRGAYSCRRARGRRARISEHALGNALDLQGFDFGPLPRGETLPEGLPRRVRRSFSIRVLSHWGPRRRRDAVHARFFHELTETLRTRPDIFRGIVGPPRPRHGNHLHLDASPWRYAMFGYQRPESQ